MQKKDQQQELLELIFSSKGLLAQLLTDYEERPGQKEMAAQILSAYTKEEIALIEAGTGIGKSLAYLVPAVIWALKHSEKTAISTHTIALQEQLIEKDIPFLLKAMNVDLKAALVKGMSNYLCLRKLSEYKQQIKTADLESDEIDALDNFACSTKDGSRSAIAFPISPSTWDQIQADGDSCNGALCPFYKQCFFFRARRKAADAQLLVINHHLFFADLSVQEKKEEASALATCNRFVFDEAHHLEEIALEHLSKKIDLFGLQRLLNRLSTDAATSSARLKALHQLMMQEFSSEKSIILRVSSDLPAEKRQLSILVDEAFAALERYCQTVLQGKGESEQREQRWKLSSDDCKHSEWSEVKGAFDTMLISLKRLQAAIVSLTLDLASLKQEILNSHTFELQSISERLNEHASMLEQFFREDEDISRVRWIERSGAQSRANLTLVDAHLDIATYMKENVFDRLSTVSLCSATLSAGKGFQYIRDRLGIEDKKAVSENVFASPFDYAKRTLLLIPTDIPNPTEYSFVEAISEKMIEAIKASKGNAFILFTSYDMLNDTYKRILPALQDCGFIPSKQGDKPRHALLEHFKANEGSVLFGTDSFWEGVDVAGEALRCVIIAKLPFKVPSNPLMQAQSQLYEKLGKDPFFDYAVPQAVMKFKQGFGRLMRKKDDRGCIVCFDKRLVTKAYGKIFLKSLPPCRTLFDTSKKVFDEMKDFYRNTK